MKASMAELEAVVTVARLGGFRAAARELGVSSSALSQSIAALETRIGVRLFNRTTRTVTLTAEGKAFATEVRPALSLIGEALSRVNDASGEPSGVLRLNMSLGAARFLLTPLMDEYLRRHPKVGVEIVTDSDLVDVVGSGFDAGVRLRDIVPVDLVAVPLLPDLRYAVVGSPSYFEGRDEPSEPADLLTHSCIRARGGNGRIYRWGFAKAGRRIELDVTGRLILDDSGLTLDAALAGMGLAYVARRAAEPHLRTGRLRAVLVDWMPDEPDLCLYYHGHRHVPGRLRAFIDVARELRHAR